MGQSCSCCNHAKRLDLDREICRGISYTKIARKFGVSRDSVAYHAENHLSRQLVTAIGKKAALENLDLLGEIEDLLQRTKRILTEAEDKKKYNLALSAIREARGVYELLSKIAFSLHQVRLTELELERERDGTAAQERDEAFQESFGVLTDNEFDMLERLMMKIQNQAMHDIIIPDPPKTVWPKLVHIEQTEDAEPEPGQDEETSTKMIRTKPPKRRHKVKPVEPTKLQPYSDK